MPTFPRKGVELSNGASILFIDATYERPGIIFRFENKWTERRVFGDSGRFEQFIAHCRVDQFDMNIIMDFLKAQDLFATPFTLVHPDYGTGTVNYASTKLPLKKIVGGNPAWFEFDVPMEGQF